MNNLRPMPILLLKQRFLKVLYKKSISGSFLPYQFILRMIPKFFRIELLTNREYQDGVIAVRELERDGYIEVIPNSKYKYMLTIKGIGVAKKNIQDMKLPLVDLVDLLISRYILLRKVYHDYKVGDFEGGIFKAFKLLEESVRLKAKLSSSVFGAPLMDKAFNKKTGLLKHPNVVAEAEQEGLHHMMRGAISFFKNPSSHRTVIFDDPNKVMHILAFANFLLDLVDECELVEPKQ